jgi:cytochrome P450 family 26 subfamily A
MKTLTFNIICALLFGIERGARREKLVDWFQEMWSIPINLPFTRYNRSLQASASIRNMTKDLIGEKRMELAKKGVNPHKDLISCMLSTRDENNREVINENEIMDNVMLVMTAGHDTSSVLITFLVRILANDPSIYAAILKGIHDLFFYSATN